jgi:hypothetical protein
VATSTGAAVTTQTRSPASRCIWASALVPGQIRSAISSSKISSIRIRTSLTRCPAMKDSAAARASATDSGVSPRIRNRTWATAFEAISRLVKNRRRYSPRARWNTAAPCSIVLSTSKNAALCASGGGVRAASNSAAAADASPASTDRARKSRVDGRVMDLT